MGTQLDAWQLVEAPAATPLPFGLFSVAEPRLVTDPHWRLGVKWISDACAPTGRTTGPCIDLEVPPLDPNGVCSELKYEPFTIYSYNTDDLVGYTLAEHREKTRQRLINGEQFGAEDALWEMIVASGPTVTDLSTSELSVALGFVEAALAKVYFGQGVIHMSRLTAIALGSLNLKQVGGRLTTVTGTPVIVGGGYDIANATPAVDSHIYGTGPVVMYRGEIDPIEDAIDKDINQASIVAQRDYVVGWDCVAVGAKIAYP